MGLGGTPRGGDMGVPWWCGQGVLWCYVPVVLGLHVHLWLLAAQPLGHPVGGTQEFVPLSSSPRQAAVPVAPTVSPHHARAHPMPPALPQAHRAGCQVPSPRVGSVSAKREQQHPTRRAAPHLCAIGLSSVLPCHPSAPRPLVCPKRKERGERTTGALCQMLWPVTLSPPLSQHWTRQGSCTHPGDAAAPYSPLALGALGVQVALQHHLSQGSQLHPEGDTAVSGLRAGNGAAKPSLVLPETTAITRSPGAPGGPGCPLSPLRPGCPGAPAMPTKPGGPGGPGKPMSPCSKEERDMAQGNSLLRGRWGTDMGQGIRQGLPSSLEAHPVLVVPAHRRLECPVWCQRARGQSPLGAQGWQSTWDGDSHLFPLDSG